MGVKVDEAFFLGGVEKKAVLKALMHISFFDDKDTHVKLASSEIPSGRVPYKSRFRNGLVINIIL